MPLKRLKWQHGRGGIPAYQTLAGLRYASQYRGRYAAEIRNFDEGLGELLRAVERSQDDRETVILLTADHAESLGEGNVFFAHGDSTTPVVTRIPFLLSAPNLAPGRNTELVHHVDVMPTLLDLAGLPVPDDVRGLALGSLLKNRAEFPSRTVYTDIGREVTAYRRDGFVRITLPGAVFDGKSERWQAYRWLADGRWSPTPLDASLRPAISSYLGAQTPTAPAGELDSADIERLRALGYLDPEE